MQDNLNLLGQNYNLPKDKDEFINTKSGEIVKQEAIDPMTVIRKIAEKIGTKIKDPNPKCKSCYGRGYIGRDSQSKAPVPCQCIYPKLSNDESIEQQVAQDGMLRMSRKQRRQMTAYAKRQVKKNKRRALKSNSK